MWKWKRTMKSALHTLDSLFYRTVWNLNKRSGSDVKENRSEFSESCAKLFNFARKSIWPELEINSNFFHDSLIAFKFTQNTIFIYFRLRYFLAFTQTERQTHTIPYWKQVRCLIFSLFHSPQTNTNTNAVRLRTIPLVAIRWFTFCFYWRRKNQSGISNR